MPKSQFIDPKDVRKSGKLTFGTIPLNQYNKSLEDEKKNFSNDDFVKMSYFGNCSTRKIHICLRFYHKN